MKLNWNFISKIFARTVGVENLSRDAEGHEVLSADQRKILEQKFGPEALQHYDAYAASDANDDAQQEQLLLNFLDAIGPSICGTLATLLRWTWSPDLMTFTASSGVVNLMGWFMVAICFVVSVEGVRRLRLSVPQKVFSGFLLRFVNFVSQR